VGLVAASSKGWGMTVLTKLILLIIENLQRFDF
jgi:hypothetical protein